MSDPYKIWVSEIMLQQTRVAVVLERYPRFLARFPTIAALAAARVTSVLAEWSGLGYYRRARAMHATARLVLRKHSGKLPSTAEALRELPGVGRYTAAAIASIAYGERVAVVDGNVERVLQRLYSRSAIRIGTRTRIRTHEDYWRRAEELLDPRRPGDFNQAMMELGATVCLPATPRCFECPLKHLCRGRVRFQRPHGRTRPEATASRKKVRAGYRVLLDGGRVYMLQRPKDAALMPSMWELPPANGTKPKAETSIRLKHAITDTDFEIVAHLERTTRTRKMNGEGPARWVELSNAGELPLTGLTRKILRGFSLLD